MTVIQFPKSSLPIDTCLAADCVEAWLDGGEAQPVADAMLQLARLLEARMLPRPTKPDAMQTIACAVAASVAARRDPDATFDDANDVLQRLLSSECINHLPSTWRPRTNN